MGVFGGAHEVSNGCGERVEVSSGVPGILTM